MPATVIAIADAVTAVLNGASLSQSFTAERHYVPVHELKDLANLTVSVVPNRLEGQLLNRAGKNMFTYVIDVGIQKVIGRGHMTIVEINAQADPLMLLAEEVCDLFDGKVFSISGGLNANCIDTKNVPIFAPDHMDEKRVFTSVVNLTFKLGR